MSVAEENAPRWSGAPGFFEIWFVVVLDPSGPRAFWLRYTTFAPATGPPRATVWAAAFEAGRLPVWGKSLVSVEHVHAAALALSNGVCEGVVDAGGHRLVWRLAIDEDAVAGRRGPRWLDRVPAPTRVAHVLGEAEVDGEVHVDGVRHVVWKACGAQKHLWGTRRVEELYWLYCPTLAEGASLEATHVRVRRGAGPAIAPVTLRTDGRTRSWCLRARVRPDGPGRLRVRAVSSRSRLDAVAACDPETLAGYVYRDPSGFDLHVAQSDVATCEATLRTRPHPLARWGAPRTLVGTPAAIEFHHPEPLPGVRYVGWDEVHP